LRSSAAGGRKSFASLLAEDNNACRDGLARAGLC
jgi:hypothetical protein